MVVRLARAARRFLSRTAPRPRPAHEAKADGASLYEGLNRLLTLADRLPSGGAGSDVRRSVCELIEAKSGVERRDTRRRLLRLIDGVTRRRALGRSRAGDADAAEMDQLLAALHHRDLR